MKPCRWPGCGGWIKPVGRCGKCGRTDDLEYEIIIRKKKRIYGLSDANYGSHYIRGTPLFRRPNYKKKEKNHAKNGSEIRRT